MGEGSTKANVLRPPDSCHVVCLKREKGQAQVTWETRWSWCCWSAASSLCCPPFSDDLEKKQERKPEVSFVPSLDFWGWSAPSFALSITYPLFSLFPPQSHPVCWHCQSGRGWGKRTMLEHNKGWLHCVKLMSEQWMKTGLSVKLDGAEN